MSRRVATSPFLGAARDLLPTDLLVSGDRVAERSLIGPTTFSRDAHVDAARAREKRRPVKKEAVWASFF